MNKLVLNVIAHHMDNGDGSTTVAFYNNEEELAAELESCRGYTVEDVKSGEDPYRCGTLTKRQLT